MCAQVKPRVRYVASFWWIVVDPTKAALGPYTTLEQAQYIAARPELWAERK